MFLQRLKLTNFKNYEFQELDLSPQLNCFTGMNGMGKTNLLDAIYYLCMGKSNFNLSDANLSRHGSDFFRLEAHFMVQNRAEKIVAKVIPRKKKEFERNDVPYQRLSEHIGLLPVVIIAPDDTSIITEGSEARRRFMDNTLSQLDGTYLQQIILYNKVLKQRNALLKQQGGGQPLNTALLATYDAQLLQPAQVIFEKRDAFLAKFHPVLQEMYEIISGKKETIDCRYLSQLKEQGMEELLQQAAEKDRILQRTTVGVHKDDLYFSIDDHALKKFASQGQRKSYLLALKLAQYELLRREKNCPPLLLLDDIFDKLDTRRVEYLIQLLLNGHFGQVFITDTHEKRVARIISQYESNYFNYKIETGVVTLD